MEFFNFFSNIGLLQAICFIIGLGLLVFEIFFPGFGAPGIAGIALLVLGVVLTAKTLPEAVILALIILALLGIAIALVFNSASKGRLSKTLILSEVLNTRSGFRGTEDYEEFLGKEGISLTPLRPAGIAEFDGVKLDVVTEGEFIPKNTRVKVVNISGRRIVVREIRYEIFEKKYS